MAECVGQLREAVEGERVRECGGQQTRRVLAVTVRKSSSAGGLLRTKRDECDCRERKHEGCVLNQAVFHSQRIRVIPSAWLPRAQAVGSPHPLAVEDRW